MLSERIEVLLNTEQRARVEDIADERGTSIGTVIREAVDAATASRQRSRREAADRLMAMELPVADLETMKREIGP